MMERASAELNSRADERLPSGRPRSPDALAFSSYLKPEANPRRVEEPLGLVFAPLRQILDA
jgi:hypothetical protein